LGAAGETAAAPKIMLLASPQTSQSKDWP
jgi:hypothetical protein